MSGERIERVQYDSSGEWLDVAWKDGRRARFRSALLLKLAQVAIWDYETQLEKTIRTAIVETYNEATKEGENS